MMVRIYFGLWAALAALAAAAFFTGNLQGYSVVVFGMAAFGLVFMGMMSVLPSTIGHEPMHTPVESGHRLTPDRARTAVNTAKPQFNGMAVPKAV